MNKEHEDPDAVDLKAPRLARYLQTAWKKHPNTVYWVDVKLAQKKGFKFYQTLSNAIILYNTLPAYCIQKAIKMEAGEIIYEKVYASPRPPPKISFKDNWMQKLGSEVAGQAESSQPTQTHPKTSTEQPSRSSAQEIDKRFLLGCKSIKVSVERSDKDKDADENVDADQVWTERPVGSEQSIDLFTQRDEIDIDFRVCLPHAVVKQAENFRVRELVKKIESYLHRQALQADLQQSNACNPLSEKSKKMIRDMGNVELFELCETIPKNAFFIGIEEQFIALVDISWEKMNPADIFTIGDWMLSQSRTMSSRRADLVVPGTVKLKRRRSTLQPIMRGRDVSKRDWQEFTIAFRKI